MPNGPQRVVDVVPGLRRYPAAPVLVDDEVFEARDDRVDIGFVRRHVRQRFGRRVIEGAEQVDPVLGSFV